ncbi:MAG TPA: sialidase family protein [Candidatus Acidoferrales bacterium]|nr:sialidase family protein [Candidatus Acidoferrales bacterium]
MVRWTIFLRRAANRFAFAIAVFAFATAAAHAQASFSPPAKISADMLATGEPQAIVAQSSNVYVVWSDQASACTASGCNKDVFFSRSTDQGTTFSAPQNLSNDGSSGNPVIALDSQEHINAIWSGGGHLFFSRSVDAGATFSSPLNIAGVTNASLAFSAAGYHPLVIDGAGNINVVWSDTNTSQIFFARSTNGGVSFSTPLNISNYAAGASSPTMSLDASGGIDVVWQGSVAGHNPYDLFFTRSTDAGASFSVAKDVSNTPSGAFFDQIGVDPAGNIDIAWNSNCPSPSFCSVVSSDVFFSQSKDAGATFSAPVQITNTQGQAAIPRVLLAIDSRGNVDLAWPQVAGGNNTAFFSRMNAGATAFSAPRQIASFFPTAMALGASGTINIAAAGADVYLLQSTDQGNTFSSTNITNGGTGNNPEAVEAVAGANGAGNVAIAWPAYNYSTSKWAVFGSGSGATQTAGAGSAGTPPAAAGFTVSATPTALAISAQSLSATTTLTFSSQGGLTGAGALSSTGCISAASQKITCTLTGFTLPANGTTTALLTVTPAVSSAAVSPSASGRMLLAILLCLAALPLAMPRKQRRLNFAFAALLFTVAVTGVGCGSAMNVSNADANGSTSAAKTPAVPKPTAQSISVPITINGTTVTVPNLTLTVQ